MLTFTDFKSWAALTEPTPPLGAGKWIWVGTFAALVLIALIIHWRTRTHPARSVTRLRAHLFNNLITSGILGLAYAFMRFEGIPNLSARIVVVGILSLLIIWGVIALVIGWYSIPKELHQLKNEELLRAYLPKQKSHSAQASRGKKVKRKSKK